MSMLSWTGVNMEKTTTWSLLHRDTNQSECPSWTLSATTLTLCCLLVTLVKISLTPAMLLCSLFIICHDLGGILWFCSTKASPKWTKIASTHTCVVAQSNTCVSFTRRDQSFCFAASCIYWCSKIKHSHRTMHLSPQRVWACMAWAE